MIPFILLLIENLKLQVVNNREILIFQFIFLNVDNSVNIIYKPFRFCVVIFDTIMEGTVSQIFYLGPHFYFM